MISVRVRFFGPLRDIVRRDELLLELPDGCTGEGAFENLVSLHPGVAKWKQSVRFAVNLDYSQFTQELQQDDEISFIPPVSGG